MEEYYRHDDHLCYYWHILKDALVFSIEPLVFHWNRFWLITQSASTLEGKFIEDASICNEYDEDDHFLVQRWDHPTLSC